MSIAELNGRPAVIVPVRKPRPLLRRSTIIFALAAMMALLLLAQHVIDAGYLREDIVALQQGEAWRTGGWLTQVVLRIVGLLPETAWQQVTLSLVAAVVAGLMYGLLDVADRISWCNNPKNPLSEVKEMTEKPDVPEKAEDSVSEKETVCC